MRKGKTTVHADLKIGSGATIDAFSTDGTLAGNSDTAVTTEKAVKTFVATEFADSGLINTNQQTIVLNAFRIAINGSLTQFNMIDGIVDEYEDESGIDTAASTNESFDAVNDLYSPFSGGIISNADIDDEDMADITDWTDVDTGGAAASTQVTFDGRSVMKLDSGSVVGHAATRTTNIVSLANVFTMTMFFEAIGTKAANQSTAFSPGDGTTLLFAHFASDGLFIQTDASGFTEVGSNLVVQGVWQEWTFDLDWTAKTMDIYLDKVLKASAVSFDFANGARNKNIHFVQNGDGVANKVSYIDLIKSGTAFAAPENMILQLKSFTDEKQPDKARIVIFEEDVDSVTLNTDLKAFASRDGGTTFTQITLVNEGEYESGRNILSASVDISAQPAGTSMEYKITTLNNKDLKIHGTGLSWD